MKRRNIIIGVVVAIAIAVVIGAIVYYQKTSKESYAASNAVQEFCQAYVRGDRQYNGIGGQAGIQQCITASSGYPISAKEINCAKNTSTENDYTNCYFA